MSNFASGYIKYINHLEQINDAAIKNPQKMIKEVEDAFHENIRNIARNISETKFGVKIIMLSGPSSSGKTTTANFLKIYLKEFGITAYTISMDDFYKPHTETPLLPNGKHDFESVNALRTDKIISTVRSIVETGNGYIPKYSFEKGCPEPAERLLSLGKTDVIIMEGIHALNPFFSRELDNQDSAIIKLYVSVKQSIKDANGRVMSPYDIRIVRRMVRDFYFRGTSPEMTISMWSGVVEGEEKYIHPYRMTADYTVNSTHIYGPCIFRNYAIPMMRKIPSDSPSYKKARAIESCLMRFEPISADLVPENSILREFIG